MLIIKSHLYRDNIDNIDFYLYTKYIYYNPMLMMCIIFSTVKKTILFYRYVNENENTICTLEKVNLNLKYFTPIFFINILFQYILHLISTVKITNFRVIIDNLT